MMKTTMIHGTSIISIIKANKWPRMLRRRKNKSKTHLLLLLQLKAKTLRAISLILLSTK
jgi:hypothetical protein